MALSTPIRADNSNRSLQDGRDVSIKAKNNIQLETRSLALVWGLGGKEDQTTGVLNDQETK